MFNLGYPASIVVFSAILLIPVIGYWRLHWNAVFSFRFAYVLTRPPGALIADWLGKPTSAGGLGWGAVWVSPALTAMIIVVVAYLAVSRRDVQASVV